MTVRRPERRLSAILAADIVGYSRLMERDETSTLTSIKVLRAEAIDPLLAEHQGRIVKLMGDGAIVEFGSVVDAVACAVAIQMAASEHQAAEPADRRIVFRIGINLGDVVVDGDDLLGDGVNVAARLEQLCEPGGVLVSGTAFDQLQGKLGMPIEFVGEQRVKNIERPVRAYRVRLDDRAPRFRPLRLGRRSLAAGAALCLLVAAGGAWWWVSNIPNASARPVVAVLPFTASAGAVAQIELADAITTGVMDQLSLSRFWTVLGREASIAYRDGAGAAHAVGREQGVDFVVTGAVHESGPGVRASAELIDPASGEQLWSERFERQTEDWATVQEELAGRIGAAVYTQALQPVLRNWAAAKATEDLTASELALLADEAREEMSKEGNARGMALTELALKRDPRASAALLIRGRLYRQQLAEGYAPADEVLAHWGELAQKLVYLDPNYPWAHVDLGAWYSFANKKVDLALAEYDRALEIAPNSPRILAQAAETMPWLGQSQRGAELLERAERFDPEIRFSWRQYQVGYFLHRFREGADLISSFTNTDRWDKLFATLSFAQLGDPAATELWRARFMESWPNYSYELSASESGEFSPAATAERALFLDGHAKARLPKCATSEQVAALKIRPLEECDAERAKLSAAR